MLRLSEVRAQVLSRERLRIASSPQQQQICAEQSPRRHRTKLQKKCFRWRKSGESCLVAIGAGSHSGQSEERTHILTFSHGSLAGFSSISKLNSNYNCNSLFNTTCKSQINRSRPKKAETGRKSLTHNVFLKWRINSTSLSNKQYRKKPKSATSAAINS